MLRSSRRRRQETTLAGLRPLGIHVLDIGREVAPDIDLELKIDEYMHRRFVGVRVDLDRKAAIATGARYGDARAPTARRARQAAAVRRRVLPSASSEASATIAARRGVPRSTILIDAPAVRRRHDVHSATGVARCLERSDTRGDATGALPRSRPRASRQCLLLSTQDLEWLDQFERARRRRAGTPDWSGGHDRPVPP